jgi:hypothetical protein
MKGRQAYWNSLIFLSFFFTVHLLHGDLGTSGVNLYYIINEPHSRESHVTQNKRFNHHTIEYQFLHLDSMISYQF